MEKIGNQKIWSYFGDEKKAVAATNAAIRGGDGHLVRTYFELAKKVAELQYLNRDHVLLFRGQRRDHQTNMGNTTLKPSLFRLNGKKLPTTRILERRFEILSEAEQGLVERYEEADLMGIDRLKRHRVLRWTILQHYEVCGTPLLDVTHSLRIAASFASFNEPEMAYLFVLGVPNLSGAVTASSEAGIQIVRLSSACPPDAVRPHLQEGYLLGEYPEIADIGAKVHYPFFEIDLARRLVAKFKFDPEALWHSSNFQPVPQNALYPLESRDKLRAITDNLKQALSKD